MPLWLEISLPIVTVLLSAGIAYWLDSKREAKRDKQQAEERAGRIRSTLSEMAHQLELLKNQAGHPSDHRNPVIVEAQKTLRSLVSEMRKYVAGDPLIREIEKLALATSPDRNDANDAYQKVDDLSRATNDELTTRFHSN